MNFYPIQDIIKDLKKGRFVILVDDEQRENEGDLVIASDFITAQAINFMAQEARGLICVSIDTKQAARLNLPLMVRPEHNLSLHQTAFTISVEAAKGVSTGISATDRSKTVQVLSNPRSVAKDIISPGHIFPIRCQDGGVLKRAGHTEASVDLCILAGLNPSAVICEIINPDGTMARKIDLIQFAKKHKLKIGSIESLIEYRLKNDSLVKEKITSPFKTSLGKDWKLSVFYDTVNNREHLALIKGVLDLKSAILVRVQTSCLTGDLFQDQLLPTGSYLKKAISKIQDEGSGVLIYLRMQNNISKYVDYHKEYQKSDKKVALKSDNKDYGIGAQILRHLGISRIKLLTNSKQKKIALKGYGLSIDKLVKL